MKTIKFITSACVPFTWVFMGLSPVHGQNITNLIGYWLFNEGHGDVAANVVNPRLNGKLMNIIWFPDGEGHSGAPGDFALFILGGSEIEEGASRKITWCLATNFSNFFPR